MHTLVSASINSIHPKQTDRCINSYCIITTSWRAYVLTCSYQNSRTIEVSNRAGKCNYTPAQRTHIGEDDLIWKKVILEKRKREREKEVCNNSCMHMHAIERAHASIHTHMHVRTYIQGSAVQTRERENEVKIVSELVPARFLASNNHAAIALCRPLRCMSSYSYSS